MQGPHLHSASLPVVKLKWAEAAAAVDKATPSFCKLTVDVASY